MFRHGTQTSHHGVLCAMEHFAPHRFCDRTSRWNTSFSARYLFRFHVALYWFRDATSGFVPFSQIQEVHLFHVFISGVVMLPRKNRAFFRRFDRDRSSFSVRARKKARLVSLLIILILSSEESEYHPPKRRQWWVNPMNTVRDERGEYLDVVVELRKYPKRFHRYFRMSVEQFDILLDCLKNSIRKKTTNWRKPIPPEIRLAVTLR